MDRAVEQHRGGDLSAKVESLPLSNRTLRRLVEAGIATVGELTRRSDSDLLAIDGFGHTCLREVRAVIQVYRASGADCLVDDSARTFPAADLPEPVLSLRLVDLPIPNRARGVFQREGIETIRDYMAFGVERLLGLRNFGSVTLCDVNRSIHTATRALKDGNGLQPLLQVPRVASSTGEGATETADLARVSIASLDLPRRARRACLDLGIRTLRDFAGLDMNELLVRRNFGQATLRRIQREVERFLEGTTESGSGFGGILASLFARLQEKERRLVELREGGHDGTPRTLGETGAMLGITESRACQIEHSAWAKLRRFAAGHVEPVAGAVSETLIHHGGLADASKLLEHALFLGCGLSPAYLGRILARLLPHHIARLQDSRLAAVPAATLCTLASRLRKRLRRGGESQDLKELVADVSRGIDLGAHSESLVRALCENVFHREVALDDSGQARVRTSSQALGDDLIGVLRTGECPLHFAEIARRITGGGPVDATVSEKVRLRLCRDPRFVLVGRGIYDLADRFRVPDELRVTIGERSEKRLRESGRPTSVALLHQSLVVDSDLADVSEFVVAAVLRDDARFRHLGRGTFALTDSDSETVAHVSDLLREILEESGGALSYAELRRRVQERRRVSDGAISATLVGRDTFLRISRGWFDLSVRYPIDSACRERLATKAREHLLRQNGVSSLDDLFHALRDELGGPRPEPTPVLLGDVLRRIGGFRFVSGGFVQLADSQFEHELEQRSISSLREAGEPMRPSSLARRLDLTAAEAALLRRVLRESSRFVPHGDGRYGVR